jgi:hypothetical protein
MSIGSRIASTIALGVAWIVIMIIHLFFFADRFNLYQNIALEIINLVIIGGLIAIIWVIGWGHKGK